MAVECIVELLRDVATPFASFQSADEIDLAEEDNMIGIIY
jgi:hypothetical protein